ncbi:ATP synthase F1 subunit delta [Bacteroidota bacterium]
MVDSAINTRYAKSLFKLAKEKNILSLTQKDMSLVFETFDEVQELTEVMKDPVLKTSEKIKVINSVFKTKISEIPLLFLNLIVNKKREFYILGIARYFLELVKKEKGIKTVVLSTASELGKKQKDNIASLIIQELNSEIELTEMVDEDLVGGFIIRVDDNQYDSSVRSELNKIEKNLLETTIEK